MDVLESNHDGVLSKRHGQHLAALQSDLIEADVLVGLLLELSILLLGPVEAKEDLERLFNLHLLRSLLGLANRSDIDVVLGIDLLAITVRIGLVERFLNTSVIVFDEASAVHDFDVAGSLEVSRATSGPLDHDSGLSGHLLVPDGDSTSDWVVVGRDVLVTRVVPHGSEVEDSLLHLETIGVGVEGLVVVSEAIELEVHDHVLASAVGNRDAVHLQLDLDWLQAKLVVRHIESSPVAGVLTQLEPVLVDDWTLNSPVGHLDVLRLVEEVVLPSLVLSWLEEVGTLSTV